MTHYTSGQLLILIVLILGTTARLTRLVTEDTITRPIRRWIEKRMLRAGMRGWWNWLDDLVNCPWCVSIWVSFPTAFIAVWHASNRVVVAGMLALTASWLAANVQTREPGRQERVIVVEDDEESSETG